MLHVKLVLIVPKEYEEFLLSEGLITEDMSERIVASLPKCLSDSTMRGSRESLRSSRESVRDSRESLLLPAASCETLSSTARETGTLWGRRRVPHGVAGPAPAGSSFRSRWKSFKRAVGRLVDGDDSSNCHGNGHSFDNCDRYIMWR